MRQINREHALTDDCKLTEERVSGNGVIVRFCETHIQMLHKCANCETWFSSRRRDTKTCSNACRVAYSRKLSQGEV